MAVIDESEILHRTTSRGTPLARSWTDEWVARVEAREDELDRRICGARTIGGTPCPQASSHASGRCGHHGGAELTGAPDGNRNAAVHMLYSRRLMTCGEHCPMWNRCPLGGGAADQGRELLKLREVDRPTCPFEQSMYNAVVTDAELRTCNHQENAWGVHVAHTVALMTVMFSRAAASLGVRTFTDKTESYGNDQLILTERFSPQSVAFEKLGRELRRWTMVLERSYEWISCDKETNEHHQRRQRTDTQPDPDALFLTLTDREFVTDAEAELAAKQRKEEQDRARQAFRDQYFPKRRTVVGPQVSAPTPQHRRPAEAAPTPRPNANGHPAHTLDYSSLRKALELPSGSVMDYVRETMPDIFEAVTAITRSGETQAGIDHPKPP